MIWGKNIHETQRSIMYCLGWMKFIFPNGDCNARISDIDAACFITHDNP